MGQLIDIQLLDRPLDVQACFDKVRRPSCGGIDVFIGTVRNKTSDRTVVRLEFEGYRPMAALELEKIAQQMFHRWPVESVCIHHRLGQLDIGEIAVIVAVGAAHRDAAFAACRFGIDTLKETVPIWKKEIFEDGEVWVAAHP